MAPQDDRTRPALYSEAGLLSGAGRAMPKPAMAGTPFFVPRAFDTPSDRFAQSEGFNQRLFFMSRLRPTCPWAITELTLREDAKQGSHTCIRHPKDIVLDCVAAQ
jgi:hypothetical protein